MPLGYLFAYGKSLGNAKPGIVAKDVKKLGVGKILDDSRNDQKNAPNKNPKPLPCKGKEPLYAK